MSDFRSTFAQQVHRDMAARARALGLQVLLCDTAGQRVAGDGSPASSFLSHEVRVGSDLVGALHFSRSASTRAADDDRLATTVEAWARDVVTMTLQERTIFQFTERLEQAYEQAHLLFGLARIPEREDECAAALEDAVDRLHGITQLGWVALRFNEGPPVIAPLRGRQMLAGSPPIDASRFASLLAAELPTQRAHVIARPDESALAAATGAEVLLQPLTLDGRRLGMLVAGNNGGDDPGLSSFETQLFAACAGYLSTFHGNVARLAEQQAMFLGTLRAITASIDAKDRYTRGHSERVALLAHDLALATGLSEPAAERYRVAGLVHDVGKIGVPEAVLCKAGRLSDEEFQHIRRHPETGFAILRDIPGLDDVRPGVLHHHERWDGTGYPHALAGDAIPAVARALALCDTFDAMSSNRSYRAKLPRDHVLAELRRCAGTQFDPTMVEAFLRVDLSRFDAALRSHADSEPAPSLPVAA